MTRNHLYTFGHSTRSEAETLDMLRGFSVAHVIDIRSLRGSRHNPQFNAETMAVWLADADVAFTALPALGGRRRGQGIDPAVNAGWRHPSFHRYADYALTDEFAAGLAELTDDATETTSAIMCAEAVPWRCHRSLVATALVARGWTVHHLLAAGKSIDHEIGRWGAHPAIDRTGRITYPAAQQPDPDR